MRQCIVFVDREEQFVHGDVEDRYDFLWVDDQLIEHRSVDLLHVQTVDVQVGTFDEMDLFELLHVERFQWVDTFEIGLFDSQMEFLQERDESTFAFVDVNVSAPDDHLIVNGVGVRLAVLERSSEGTALAVQLTRSSCSLTKRKRLVLPRSDLVRDGVDMGVRVLVPMLLCVGDMENVMGEKAMAKRDMVKIVDGSWRSESEPRYLFGVRRGVNGS